ncbi:MAG: ABC transporter substrate-binding protein, partial [Flavobacteriales bacterium]
SFVLLCILASCANPAKRNKNASSRLNLCHHSKYLKVFKTEKGYQVRIQDPDRHQIIFDQEILDGSYKMAVLSATHVGMISALNAEKTIVGISDIRYVYSPKVRRLFAEKKIIELHSEQSFPVEILLTSEANFLVYSAFSGSFPAEKRLKKLGIISIPDYDWREQSALGRADWLLLFGVLCHKVPEAMSLLKSIETAYQRSVKKKITSIKMISGNLTGEYWYAPAGGSFMAEIFRKSGLNYIYSETSGTGSLAYSMEKIVTDGQKTHLWLNPGFSSKELILKANPKAKYLPFFQKGNIFCYTHNGNKFWEMSTLRPDWLLEDLSAIANAMNTDHLHFYREVK